jgi:hypothetical protein
MQPQAEVKDQKTNDNAVQAPAQAQTPPVETQEQINWRKFREIREQERKAKEKSDAIAIQKSAEAEALKKAMEALLNKPQPQQMQQSYQSQDMTDEQRMEAMIDARFKQRMQQEEQVRMERQKQEEPAMLRRQYKDFDQVCSQQNLDYLEYHYPEVANAFNGRPDNLEKWSDIYKAVKRFIPNTDSSKESAKADKNFNKPQSMAVPGATPMGDTAPQMLSDARKKANWERMERVRKGV